MEIERKWVLPIQFTNSSYRHMEINDLFRKLNKKIIKTIKYKCVDTIKGYDKKYPVIVLKKYGINERFYLNTIQEEIRFSKFTKITGNGKAGDSCKITIKGNGTLSRAEYENPITLNFYKEMRLFIENTPIIKWSFYYILYMKDKNNKLKEYEMQVSIVYPLQWNTFTYMEIEFPSEKEAKAFTLLTPNVSEVTDNPAFKMRNIWDIHVESDELDKKLSEIKRVVDDTIKNSKE